MKKSVLLFSIAFFLVISDVLLAQGDLTPKGMDVFQVKEETRYMSQGNNPALVVELPQADPKLVAKLWKKYIQDYDAKVKKGKEGELFADDADIPGIGEGNTVDVYAKIKDSGDGSELSVWFYLGGAYLQSKMHPDRFKEGERFMEQFAIMVKKELIEQEVKAEESRLKELENELKKLERDNERYHQIIAEAEKRIEQAKADIEENEKAQKDTQKALEEQRKRVEEVKDRLKKIE